MPVAVGLVALPSLIMLCVAPLACYHCSLVCANKTTSEEIKDVRWLCVGLRTMAGCASTLRVCGCGWVRACRALTSRDAVRAQTFRNGNPFSGTLRHNCNEACCVREPPRIRPRALAASSRRGRLPRTTPR